MQCHVFAGSGDQDVNIFEEPFSAYYNTYSENFIDGIASLREILVLRVKYLLPVTTIPYDPSKAK